MKKILVMVMVLAWAVSGTGRSAHALTMCAANWLDAWRETTPVFLLGANMAYTAASQNGTWAVGAVRGGMGPQSVTGISRCSSTTGVNTAAGNFTCTAPNSDTHVCRNQPPVPQNGGNCWCRMISPNVGTSWVFQSAFSESACASNCVSQCANSLNSTPAFRAAVLAVP